MDDRPVATPAGGDVGCWGGDRGAGEREEEKVGGAREGETKLAMEGKEEGAEAEKAMEA